MAETASTPDKSVGQTIEQQRAADFAARHFRWNFTALVLDAATFFAGLAFLEGTTVLPVLLRHLNGSDTVVGFARFLQTLGFTLPALLGAHYIHGRALHKPFLLTACAIGRFGMLTLPFVFLGLANRAPSAALAWFLVVYGLFWFIDGVCSVSWFDIVGKTIPPPVRGRFFGVMQTLSGIGAIAAGFLVKDILQRWPFPLNFALLSAGACAGTLISLGFLAVIREPRGSDNGDLAKPRFAAFTRSALPLLRRNPRLRHLLAARLLLDGGSMALPFYILFAERDLDAGLRMVGVFAVVQSVGKVAGGPVWGWLSDRFGPVAGLRAVAVSVSAIPLLALLSRSGSPLPLYGVFALIGAVQDGIWMVGSTTLLASVSSEERPLAVGISSLLQAPGAVFGLVGGALAAATSYPVVFAAAAGFGAAAVLMTFRMESGRAGAAPTS